MDCQGARIGAVRNAGVGGFVVGVGFRESVCVWMVVMDGVVFGVFARVCVS